MKNQKQILAALLLGLSIIHTQLGTVYAQTTAFTFQGRLADGVNFASGIYDFRFAVFDMPIDGTALAGPITNAPTSVSNGLFTVLLDFGANVFAGADRWLEIGVRTNGAVGLFTVLAPRQFITPAPLALSARNAATAGTVTSVPVSALPSSVPRLDTNSLLYFVGNMTLGQTPLPLNEGFESMAFPPAGWSTGGNTNWSRTTSTCSEGTAAAVCGDIGDHGISYLELTYNFPVAGSLEFDWKVSSEDRFDFLQIRVDGVIWTRIAGEVSWTPVTLPVSAGMHTFRWEYDKDGSISTGSDCGWLDHVRISTGLGGILTLEEALHCTSAKVGHCPAIYLNHTGTNGRNYRLASYGDNVNPGSFRIRDETAAADRLTIDSTGMVNVASSLVVSGNLGIHTGPSSRAMEVNGVIGVMDGGALGYNGGIMTEAGAQLINIGINDGTANRFGGNYGSAYQGGFVRIDARPWYPLFGFFARRAGSSNDVIQVASISTNGTVTATAFNTSSDRDLKESFMPLDAREVLDKVAALPLSEWSFKQEPGVRHLGPMAQDFHAAFGLGTDDKHIATVDADGVALAAIQGLDQKLQRGLQQCHAENARLQQRVAALEALLQSSVQK